MNKKILMPIISLTMLAGCSQMEEIDYDDYSLYQYDEPDNYGLGWYEDHDFQDDFYKGSPFHRHLNMSRRGFDLDADE